MKPPTRAPEKRAPAGLLRADGGQHPRVRLWLLLAMATAVSQAAFGQEPTPSQTELGAALERTLAEKRPEWSPEARKRFATEVSAHFFEVVPPESLAGRVKKFQEAFGNAVKFTYKQLLTPSMLPYDIEQFKWRIELWVRKGDLPPEVQERIIGQAKEILAWGAAEIKRARPDLRQEEIEAAREAALQDVTDSCRPLSVAFRPLTEGQAKEVRDRFQKQLVQGPGLPVPRGPGAEPLFHRLLSAMGSFTPSGFPKSVWELAGKVDVEMDEWIQKENSKSGLRLWAGYFKDTTAMFEPFEWLGCWAAQLLGALEGRDPWLIAMW